MKKIIQALRSSYLPAILVFLFSTTATRGQNVSGFTRVSVKVHDAKGRIVSEILGIPTDTLSTAPCGRSIAIVNNVFFFRDTSCVWTEIQGSGGGTGGNADSLNSEPPSYYLNRTNHTGTQAQSTVTGLVDSVSALRTAVTARLTPEAANLLYKPLSYQPTWGEIIGKPTTVSGYGITNAWTWGGNAFGAAGIIGTLDNNDFQIVTNNTVRVWVGPVTGMVRINTPSSIYGQLQVTGIISAFEERIVSSSVSGNKRMVFGFNPGNFLEIAGETHAGAPGQNFWMQRYGGDVLVGGLTDQGDYKLQGQGGLYWDFTAKTLRLVGLPTDNTSSQIMARDASGNTVWRDVSSISGSDNWGSQSVVTNTTLNGNGTSGSPLAVDVDEVLSGVGVLDWDDGGGTGDSLVIVDGDTVRIKSLEFAAGSNVTVTPDHTAGKLKYTIAASTGGVSDGDKGDITVSSSGTVWTTDNNVITYAKMQQIPTASILGRYNSGTGNVEPIAYGGALQVSGGTMDVRIADGSNYGAVSTTTQTFAGLKTFSTGATGRWVPRVGSTTSSATPTINTDNVDIYKLTAQAADITSFTTNLSGTPNDGDILEIQITGTASRAITWGTSFVASSVALPTTTSGTTTLTVIFQYYTTSSYGNNKWVCVNSY